MSCTRIVMDKLQCLSTQITGTGKEKIRFSDYLLLGGTGAAALGALASSPGLVFLTFFIAYPAGVYFQWHGYDEDKKMQYANVWMSGCQRPEYLIPEPNIVSRCLEMVCPQNEEKELETVSNALRRREC